MKYINNRRLYSALYVLCISFGLVIFWTVAEQQMMWPDCRWTRAQITVMCSFLLQKFKEDKVWKSSPLPGVSDTQRTSSQNLLDPAPWMPLNHQSHSRLCHGFSPERKGHILMRQQKVLAKNFQSHLDRSFSPAHWPYSYVLLLSFQKAHFVSRVKWEKNSGAVLVVCFF